MIPTMEVPKVPYNEAAEQGLLGTLLIDNRTFDKIDGLKSEHFYAPAHQRIFGAIQEIIGNGRTASPITLKQKFENDNDLQHVGGAEYLAHLAASVISVVNAADYGEVIKEQYSRRKIQDAGFDLINLARDGRDDAIISEAERIMNGIGAAEDYKLYSTAEAADEALQWMNDVAAGLIKPAMTGMRGIDHRIGGLFPAALYVIAARPGMGKTAFALSIADNIAANMPCLFFSLEMSRQELTQRLLAARTGIDITSQRKPANLTPDQWQALKNAKATLPAGLHIDDRAAADMGRIRTMARRFKRKNPSFVMFIDYLGLMKMDADIRNRVHQIEEITTGLKALAKELQIPIVLLSQLSRAVEAREDQRPCLSDLRDSGSIEQDADAVMFIYRQEYYEERKEPQKKSGDTEQKYMEKLNDWKADLARCRGKAEIIFGKNRQGKLGSEIMSFSGERQRFS